MSDNTKIEWADATVNAVNGCSVISPGCTNCYAMKLAGTRMKTHPTRAGLTMDTKAGPVWTGDVRLHEPALLQPLRWKRPRRIFWNAHGDLFHEAVPDGWIDRVFAVCALTPQHTHMILTKRSARMREFFRESTGWRARIAGLLNDHKPSALWNGNVYQGWQNLHGRPDGLPNVWLGVSVEDQARADERIPDLLATPAAVRFISAEPLLGPVDLTNITGAEKSREYGSPVHGWSAIWRNNGIGRAWLDWVIAGGESGPGARPMHPDWARSLRDQCAEAGVAFHFKQWGEWAPIAEWQPWDRKPQIAIRLDGERMPNDDWFDDGSRFKLVGKARASRVLDGRTHDEFPSGGEG